MYDNLLLKILLILACAISGCSCFRTDMMSLRSNPLSSHRQKISSTVTRTVLKADAAGGFFSKVKKLQKAFDDEVWDLFQGAKERKWSPDRRPEGSKGERAGPGPDTVLSWGGAQSIETYERMVEKMEDDMEGVNPQTPLGSASVTMYGEGGKLDSDEMEAELDAFRDQQAPALGSDSRNIADAVELAELVRAKYGKYHDVAILRNTGQIAMNLYGPHLSQRAFPYTEEQYMQKLSTIVLMLNDFDQAWYVKQFLLSPIVPRNGLPSTPRFDTAVTLRLNLSPTWKNVPKEIVDGWFAFGG